jgi:hypothetical protein
MLGLELMMLYFYYDFALQGLTFRVVSKGILGLGLIMVYYYYEFALRSRKFRVV